MDEQAKGERLTTGELARHNRGGEILGFLNGCFDPLHAGHVSLIVHAKRFCDRLVVAINTDHQVTNLKGRCGIGEKRRAEVLGAIAAVDAVLVFSEPHPGRLIQDLKPDVVFKGTDYANRKPQELPDYLDIQQAGAALVYLPLLFAFNVKISSSDLLKNVPGGAIPAGKVLAGKVVSEYMKRQARDLAENSQ